MVNTCTICHKHAVIVCSQRQQLVSVGESRDCTTMVRGPRHGSLSGVLYGCARLPMHTSGGSTDVNQPLLLLSSLSHAFLQLNALLPLTGLCSQMLRPSCAPSSGVPWSCLFGRCTLLSANHTGFGKPHQLFAAGVCGPSASPTSVEVCGAAGRMCESRVGPISFGWSQIDDGHMVGCLWLWVGLVPSVVSMVVVASFHYKSSGVTIALERLSNMFLLFFRVWEVQTDLLSTVKEGAGYCHLVCQGVMGLEVQVLVRVCALPKHRG